VVREDDGNHAAKRAANRFQDRDAAVDVRPDFRRLDLRQSRGFVQHFPTDFELPDVVKKSRGTDVLDALGAEAERFADS
jgi:hypothetical protein